MDNLPPELLEIILCSLPKNDALKARLVSKTLAHVATPIAFRQYTLCYFGFSLYNLHSIATSRCAKFVRSVVIYTDSLRSVERSYFHQEMRRLDNPVAKYVDWDVCAHYIHEQLEYQSHWSFVEMFSTLPKLEEVDFQGCVSRHAITGSYQLMPKSTSTIRYLSAFCGRGTHSGNDDEFVKIVDALAAREAYQRPPVKRLIILELALSEALPIYLPRDDRIQHHAALTTLMENLSDLHFVLREGDVSTDQLALRRMLQHSSRLQSLTLSHRTIHLLSDSMFDRDRALTPLLIASPPVFPSLKSLKLSVVISSEELLVFLRSHSKTLTSLTLRKCIFDDVEAIKQGVDTILQLPHIEVQQPEPGPKEGPIPPWNAHFSRDGLDSDTREWLEADCRPCCMVW